MKMALLYLVVVLLGLTSSAVLCDHELLPLSSDLRLIHWKGLEDCVEKVNRLLSNVTAFCEGNGSGDDPAVISCQDVTSNLMKLLHSEQAQFKNCKVHFSVAKSLLETCEQHLLEFKEVIRGMLGIAVRYQGNRTSLNELLNLNHQQLLRSVEVVLQDIHNWNPDGMNASNWEVGFRHLDECEDNLKICNEGLVAKMNDLMDCRGNRKGLENATMPDIRNLRIDLNATAQKLWLCESDREMLNTRLEEELKEKKQWNETSTFFIEKYNKCFESLQKEEDKNKELKEEIKILMQNLVTCNITLSENEIKKDKCLGEMINLQEEITSQTNLLLTNFTLIPSVEDSTEAVLDDFLTASEKIHDNVRLLFSKVKALKEQIKHCEIDKSSLQDTLEVCRDEARNIENRKSDSEKRALALQTELRTCNEKTNQLQNSYSELDQRMSSTKMQLQQTISILNSEKEELERRYKDLQEQIGGLQGQFMWKEEQIKKLEDDKYKLNKEIENLEEELNKCARESRDVVQQLQSKEDSVANYMQQLHWAREEYNNYKLQCEMQQNKTLEESLQNQHSLIMELNSIKQENENLKREKLSLQNQNQGLATELDNIRITLTNVSQETQDCVEENYSLTKIIELKESYIEDLERQNANMNLTSKLTHIKISTKMNELELKLQCLDNLLKSNRNEIKMLQEYGVILIMLVNKNADIMSFLKEAINVEGEGYTQAVDEKLEALLRRLLKSVEEHHTRIYSQLLQMKPYMNKEVPLRVRREVQRGRTPNAALLDAAREGNVTETAVLLDVGADVNVQDKKGLTSLHWAARQGHADVAELLLTRGAEPNVPAPAMGNKIPLHLAAEYGHPEATEVLLDFGSNIEALALDHATPLLYAANSGNEKVVSILLERGADVRSTNAYHKSALDLAENFPNVMRVINRFIYGNE